MKHTFITTCAMAALLPIPAFAAPGSHSSPLPPVHAPQLLPEGPGFPVVAYNPFAAQSDLAKTNGTASRIMSQYAAAGTAAGSYRNKDSVRLHIRGVRGGDLNSNISFREISGEFIRVPLHGSKHNVFLVSK